MSTRHTIKAEIEVHFQLSGMPDDEREVAYPEIEITYDFSPGCPARIRYDENDHPAESPEVEVISAKLLDGDGLDPTQDQVWQWAEVWLDGDGFDRACEQASEPPDRKSRCHKPRRLPTPAP